MYLYNISSDEQFKDKKKSLKSIKEFEFETCINVEEIYHIPNQFE